MEIFDFYADWCGPCQMMKPIVEEFKKAHPEIKVTTINIDEEEKLTDEYCVTTIPCLVVLKDGEEIGRAEGVQSLKKLEKLVEV